MQLSFDQITSVLFGALECAEGPEGLQLNRFTEAQRQILSALPNANRLNRSLASAGIHLDFFTDSDFLELSLLHAPASSQPVCYTDVYEDGRLLLRCGFENAEGGPLHLRAALKPGRSRVTVWLPCLFSTVLRSIRLADGASLEPAPKKERLLFLGDSITQGYITPAPSLCYTNLVTAALEADCLNQAIAGARFGEIPPEMTGLYRPDRILIAYGTNDFSHREEVAANAAVFLRNVRTAYPGVPIIGVLPIWRGILREEAEKQRFLEMLRDIRAVYETLPDCTVLDGMTLVAHTPDCFAPDVLHPNTEGFRQYAENLLKYL